MRDYARISPQFWTSDTGKALRKKGSEALVVALYLMTAPGSNMLGLYYQPVLYMAHETGLGSEGASKGLADCVACGFCQYDEESEMVWVINMAEYQIASELKASDKRCAGIQKDYDALPSNPFLGRFFDRYRSAFHLQKKRGIASPSDAPPKQGEGEGEGEGTSGKDGPSGKSAEEMSKTELWHSAVSLLSEQGMPEPQARSLIGKLVKDYTPQGDDIVITAVRAAVAEQPGDARAYLKATCQRLAGERKRDGGADWTRNAT